MNVSMITMCQGHQLSKCCMFSVSFPCFIYFKSVYSQSLTVFIFCISQNSQPATHFSLENNNNNIMVCLMISFGDTYCGSLQFISNLPSVCTIFLPHYQRTSSESEDHSCYKNHVNTSLPR